MLFQDQLGNAVTPARARAQVAWLRLVTDLPVGLHGLFLKRWGLFEYWKSVMGSDTEAVFDWRDLLPSLAEAALIPYHVLTRGY